MQVTVGFSAHLRVLTLWKTLIAVLALRLEEQHAFVCVPGFLTWGIVCKEVCE